MDERIEELEDLLESSYTEIENLKDDYRELKDHTNVVERELEDLQNAVLRALPSLHSAIEDLEELGL